SVVILYYDYLLTLPQEIQFMWKGARKTSTILYFFCRYAMVANMMYLVYKTPGVTGLRVRFCFGLTECSLNVVFYCKSVNHTAGILAIFGHIGVLGVWGLRTVAICNGNRFVPWILGLLGLTIIGLRIVRVSNFQQMNLFSGLYCSKVGIAVAGIMMGFEGLAFSLAAFRVWKTVRDDRKFWSNPQTSINYVIFSQGFLYITAVFGASILTAIFNLKIWGGIARPLNSFKLPMSGLLTARFLLRLRSWEQRTREATDEISTEMCFDSNPGAQHGVNSEAYGTESGLSQRNAKSRGVRSGVSRFGGNVGPALDPNDTRLKSTVPMDDRPSAPLEKISESKTKV
ncbi:hypothetical protein BKA70DRAFT_1115612, partial [Coprinopsis sp. MPI-PUGE-AT-0042]